MTAPAPRTIADLDVPLADVLADLDRIHAKLLHGALTPELLVQVHEFLDIDPDIAHREYPPFERTHPAVTATPNSGVAQ